MTSNQEERDLESDKIDQSEVTNPETVIQKIAEGSIDGQVSCVNGPMRGATVSFGVIEAITDSLRQLSTRACSTGDRKDQGEAVFEHVL